ncbi:hypothetical protein FRB90_007394, partial [Tulasnella sp. 427]
AEAHSQCTEPFYKREVEDQIRTAPATSIAEKKRMMEMLQRFEEDSRDDDLAGSDEENDLSDDEDDLAKKLEGVDLGNDSQREAFLKAVQDPTGERAQELLASDEIHTSLRKPWWTAPSGANERETARDSAQQFGAEPKIMELPQELLKQPPSSRIFLLHNVFALVIAYAAATRSVGTSPLASATPFDAAMAEEIISQAVPFLTDPKSTTVFTSVDGAWTDVVSRLDDVSPSTLRILLQDTETLLRHELVSEARNSDPLNASPFRRMLLVFSDLHTLFSSQRDGRTSKSSKAIQRKLEFYAAHVYASDASDWELLLAVIRKKRDELRTRTAQEALTPEVQRATARSEPHIEEIDSP